MSFFWVAVSAGRGKKAREKRVLEVMLFRGEGERRKTEDSVS